MSSGGAVDFTFHNVSIPATRAGYGLQISGNSPVLLSTVAPGSTAERGGARTGDYLIVLNGKDVQFGESDEVASTLKHSYGAALELRVARPHPLPATDLDRRRAILTLQTKLRTGDYVTCGNEVENYKSKLSNALADVDDILGGFELPGTNQLVPDRGGTKQEVEVSFYDDDNLSSPPSSKGSEVDVAYDPLLDFSREDDLVHHHGNQTKGGGFASSVKDMQREMDKMKALLRDVSEKSAQKKKGHAAPQPNNPLMRTEAAFTPNYPSHHTHPQLAVTMATTDIVEDIEPFDDQILWHDSPLTSGGHVTSADSGRKPAQSAPKKPEKSPPPKSVGKSVSPPPREIGTSPPKAEQRTRRQQSPPPREVESNPAVVTNGTRHKTPPPKQQNRGVSPPIQTVADKSTKQHKEPKRTKSPSGKLTRSFSPEGKGQSSKFLFRRKKAQLPSAEPEGVSYRKKGERQVSPSGPARGVESPSPTAGLPSNVHSWRKEEVGLWIKSISMSLYAHYYPLFSRHQITGQSLLRLTGAKLKMMGITNSAHCRTLATEIARLKIRQERAELQELQGDDNDDESGRISDL